jgi:hypothetical protein
LLTTDGGDPETDPGLDRTYELLLETIREYLDQEEEEPEE